MLESGPLNTEDQEDTSSVICLQVLWSLEYTLKGVLIVYNWLNLTLLDKSMEEKEEKNISGIAPKESLKYLFHMDVLWAIM